MLVSDFIVFVLDHLAKAGYAYPASHKYKKGGSSLKGLFQGGLVEWVGVATWRPEHAGEEAELCGDVRGRSGKGYPCRTWLARIAELDESVCIGRGVESGCCVKNALSALACVGDDAGEFVWAFAGSFYGAEAIQQVLRMAGFSSAVPPPACHVLAIARFPSG